MTESTGRIGDDFSMNICKKWEAAFFEEKHERLRKVALRTSIVLGNDGGAFPKLGLVTKLGLGGKQ
ncbi:MAG: epimerase, partial [Spirosomaceae bacterium]|nr:epimerase [Spirosomataceae bacterium]